MHYPHKISKVKRARKLGFRKRMSTKKGRQMINRVGMVLVAGHSDHEEWSLFCGRNELLDLLDQQSVVTPPREQRVGILRGATVSPHAVFDVPAVLARAVEESVTVLPGPPTATTRSGCRRRVSRQMLVAIR